jgi:hypothetical protein
MRRSRRKGQSRRTRSMASRSHSTSSSSSCGQNPSEGIDREGLAPEADLVLATHPVHRRHEHAVGDGVRPLAGLPGIVLGGVDLLSLVELPADGGGIEEDLGPGESGQPGRLGEPLVPAHQRADPRPAGVAGPEAEVPRSEVELLVVEGIVRDVHLPVDPDPGAVGVEGERRVVMDARGPPLEERGHQHDLPRCRELGERLGGGSGNRLSQIEARRILALAGIARAEELRETHQLGPRGRRLLDPRQGLLQVLPRILGAAHLHQPDRKQVRHGARLCSSRVRSVTASVTGSRHAGSRRSGGEDPG